MLHTLGLILVALSGGGLILVGLYGLAPGIVRRLPARTKHTIRIEERRLLDVADLTPKPAKITAREHKGPVPPDPHAAEEIFAEIFSLRADVAAITDELRHLRERLESAGDSMARDDAGPAAPALHQTA